MVRGNFGFRRDFGHQMRPPFKKPFVPRPFFDLTWLEMNFPKDSTKKADDTELTNVSSPQINTFVAVYKYFNTFSQGLLKRNQENLSPNAIEQAAISNLVSKVQGILDNLAIAPGDLNICVVSELN